MAPEKRATSSNTQAQQVEQLLAQMTLAEKVGQMAQVDQEAIAPAEVAAYHIGSVLSGGGGNPTPNNPQTWAQMVRSFTEAALTTRLSIPLLYGTDAVHGHSNVRGAVIFPHNVGLGATRNADLVAKIGQITAAEVLATGAHWTFAPTVAVAQDMRWGRTYESFGTDTALAAELGVAYLRGLRTPVGEHKAIVLESFKHYLADGGTRWGSRLPHGWLERWPVDPSGKFWMIDQGDTAVDEATLRRIHLPPYQAAVEAGALNIMVSYSSWQGMKLHAHRYLLTDVLKGELGFTGFLISDHQAIDQLAPDYYACVVAAINAGLDMVMVPYDYRRYITTLTQAVENGDVSLARIDDATRRILAAKFAIGVFEHPFGDESLLSEVGSAAHRAVAREAVRESLVLLKNTDHLLPLDKSVPRILVAGQAADDIGLQCGGWTIEWMGGIGAITPGTTILDGIRQAVSPTTQVIYQASGAIGEDEARYPLGIFVLAENPYAEGLGDRADLSLPAYDLDLIARVRGHCDRLIVILLTGRPLIITDALAQCDAFIAAWLPGTEGAGVADVLFGDFPFTGKLPHPWPRSMAQVPLAALAKDDEPPLFPYGYGQ